LTIFYWKSLIRIRCMLYGIRLSTLSVIGRYYKWISYIEINIDISQYYIWISVLILILSMSIAM
jgi:hypothetical protein